MDYKIVAFYPYTNEANSYHGTIKNLLSDKYFVVDYMDVQRGIIDISHIDVLFFNWIEDSLTTEDKKIVLNAVREKKQIIWVFHNRISHNREIKEMCENNIHFLIENTTDIIVLSKKSKEYLKEYVSDADMKKVHYVPHQDFICHYGRVIDEDVEKKIYNKRMVFSSIGIIREDKNIDIIVEGFRRFSVMNKEAVLLIIGKELNQEYMQRIYKLADGDENIVIINKRVSDSLINYYFQSSDIILLPYDPASCMNSGVMLLSLTNKRTFITSDISMSSEFNDSYYYKFSYKDREENIKSICEQMTKAYKDGRDLVRTYGKMLYDEMRRCNSKAKVKNELYNIIDRQCKQVKADNTMFCSLYAEKELWRERYSFLAFWMNNKREDSILFRYIKKEKTVKWAIYGYGKIGQLLLREMEEESCYPTYIIDQNPDRIKTSIPQLTLEQLKERLDFMIVTTPTVNIEKIREYVSEVSPECYVVRLKDID